MGIYYVGLERENSLVIMRMEAVSDGQETEKFHGKCSLVIGGQRLRE
jgi:hypothetical protein